MTTPSSRPSTLASAGDIDGSSYPNLTHGLSENGIVNVTNGVAGRAAI